MTYKIGKVNFNLEALIGFTKTKFVQMYKGHTKHLGKTPQEAYDELKPHIPKVVK